MPLPLTVAQAVGCPATQLVVWPWHGLFLRPHHRQLAWPQVEPTAWRVVAAGLHARVPVRQYKKCARTRYETRYTHIHA